MLPDYISRAVPVPREKRAPWYVNTAPSYAGVFLWVAFYQSIAEGTISRAGVGVCMLALAVAGLLSWALYYYAPAMLGMKTGYTLYVVGSSTFGTRGGYLMPGILMGLLQVGWFAVSTFYSTTYILRGLRADAPPGSPLFILVAVLWGAVMGYIGVKGIQYVAKVALFLNLIALLMVLVVFLQTSGGIAQHQVKPEDAAPWASFTLLIQLVIGFFATAGARALHPELTAFGYDAVIGVIGGVLATAMFFLFAVASVAPTCFCAFIIGNSFATMFPSIPRMSSTLTGVAVAVVLAITGVAANLAGVFTIVGASFGPICGAITADYLLSGRRWAGPREGINWAGYISWGLGFAVGIIPFLPLPEAFKAAAQPVVVWSYAVGFVVYALLAKAGLQPKPVPVTQ